MRLRGTGFGLSPGLPDDCHLQVWRAMGNVRSASRVSGGTRPDEILRTCRGTQYAPEDDVTARIVFHKISRSPTIDQFST